MYTVRYAPAFFFFFTNEIVGIIFKVRPFERTMSTTGESARLAVVLGGQWGDEEKESWQTCLQRDTISPPVSMAEITLGIRLL